jgi:hypothetical protein
MVSPAILLKVIEDPKFCYSTKHIGLPLDFYFNLTEVLVLLWFMENRPSIFYKDMQIGWFFCLG